MTPATEPLELTLIKKQQLEPIVDRVRGTLPMTVIAALEVKLNTPGFSIEDEEEAARVNGYMRDCRDWEVRIEEGWKPTKEFWFTVHKAACAAEKETAPAIGRIKQVCQKVMGEWIKLKAKRDRERQDEINRQVEVNRRQQERDARAAAFDGDLEKAAELLKDANAMRAPVIMTGPTKLEGTSVKPTFTPTVEDLMLFVKAVADGRVPLMQQIVVRGQPVEVPVIEVNETVMKFMAGKLGHQLNWPGVKVEDGISFASRKR